jgi:hypothetical protein
MPNLRQFFVSKYFIWRFDIQHLYCTLCSLRKLHDDFAQDTKVAKLLVCVYIPSALCKQTGLQSRIMQAALWY